MECRMCGPSAGKQTGVPRANWQAGLTSIGEFWDRLRDPASMAKVERSRKTLNINLGCTCALIHMRTPPPTHTHTPHTPVCLNLACRNFTCERDRKEKTRQELGNAQAGRLSSEVRVPVGGPALPPAWNFPRCQRSHYSTFHSFQPSPLAMETLVQWVSTGLLQPVTGTWLSEETDAGHLAEQGRSPGRYL